ncbi:hypothetical protein HaLaN_29206, partial [Haematococcus lacustris]
MRKVNK